MMLRVKEGRANSLNIMVLIGYLYAITNSDNKGFHFFNASTVRAPEGVHDSFFNFFYGILAILAFIAAAALVFQGITLLKKR